jgi:MFS family permease
VNTVIFGISLLLFSHLVNFPLAMVVATLSGFGMMSQTTISMTLIQLYSAKAMRGRVMSYVAMAYFGMLPLGSLLIGALSQKIGAPNTILCEGVTALIIAAFFSGFLRSGQQELKEKNQSII